MKRLLFLLCCIVLVAPFPLRAAEHVPTRYGLATLHGTAYDPDHIGLSILQGFALFDYDRVFWHSAPPSLRLKLEGNLGITTDGRDRSFGSLNMLALYYLGNERNHWRPYGEAGIGLIYTDFHVRKQGLHLNFNPQFGAGIEYSSGGTRAWFAGMRFHHISNGNLHEENRGINSWLVMAGGTF